MGGGIVRVVCFSQAFGATAFSRLQSVPARESRDCRWTLGALPQPDIGLGSGFIFVRGTFPPGAEQQPVKAEADSPNDEHGTNNDLEQDAMKPGGFHGRIKNSHLMKR